MHHYTIISPKRRTYARRFAILLLIVLLATACNTQPHWPAQNQATFAAMDMLNSDDLCTVEHPTAMTTGFFVLLGAGLLTGLSHCLGMCGPLVGAFALRRRAARQELSSSLVLFQTGRLTTYALLGLLMGSLGYMLASAIRSWQGVLSVVLGVFVILLGLSLLGVLPFQRWIVSTKLAALVSGWIKHLMDSKSQLAPFGLGLANGLLPCGPVYAMALLAATGGTPLRGAMVMLIFGLGTLPAMLGVGLSSSMLSVGLRSHLYRVAAVLVVIVGVQLTMRGLALGGQIAHGAIGGVMLW